MEKKERKGIKKLFEGKKGGKRDAIIQIMWRT